MQLELDEINLINAIMPTIGNRINEQIASVTVVTENGAVLLQKYEQYLQTWQKLNAKLNTFYKYDIG